MKNLYQDNGVHEIIKTFPEIDESMAELVYVSRLLGREEELVLHGGGNTSLKTGRKDIFGKDEDILFIKGSGKDLARIVPDEFTPLRLKSVQQLHALSCIPDEDLDNYLKISMIQHDAPFPSVETLLHGFLKHRFVLHTHADSILALTNQKNAREILKEALGENIGVIPYQHSGIPLAKAALSCVEQSPDIKGLVVLEHGIFTFAQDAETAYTNMIDLVTAAEKFINAGTVKKRVSPQNIRAEVLDTEQCARILNALRGAANRLKNNGKRFISDIRRSSDIVLASQRPDIKDLCQTGVLTPDHAVRTGNRYLFLESLPQTDEELILYLEKEISDFAGEREKEFYALNKDKKVAEAFFDPAPGVAVVQGLGIVGLGETRNAARVNAGIAEHTLRVKICADTIGEYRPLDPQKVFAMEYWPFQLNKIKAQQGTQKPLTGQVAVVTGAGGAIGLGICDRLAEAGAVVVLSDIDEKRLSAVYDILAERHGEENLERIPFDVTRLESVGNAYHQISNLVGGIDIIVPNAGIAHVDRIESLGDDSLEKAVSVNLFGLFHTIKAAIPVFRRQKTGGNVVVISSKNVFDPGAAFSAYSATKAAGHQMARIAALELAELSVRVNLVNPDAVFGDERVSSKLWDLVGPDRMRARGLSPEGLKEYYRNRNLLKAEVSAEHVGNAVVFFASGLTPTTGATLPVDGGVPAAFPR